MAARGGRIISQAWQALVSIRTGFMVGNAYDNGLVTLPEARAVLLGRQTTVSTVPPVPPAAPRNEIRQQVA